jgi:hypothetical protein
MPLSMLTLANKLTAGTSEGKQQRELMRTGVREIKAIIAADMPAEPFLELPLETLIVVGEKSPAYFGVACGQIHDVLSGSSYTILPGFGHDGVIKAPDKLIKELATSTPADPSLVVGPNEPSGLGRSETRGLKARSPKPSGPRGPGRHLRFCASWRRVRRRRRL